MAPKTFIHHDGALGDLLLSLPAIRLIGENSGPVHLAGRSDAAELLKTAGCVQEASSAGSPLFSSLYAGDIDKTARAFLSGFDRALIFTVKGDSIFAGTMKTILPDTRTVLTVPPEGARMHVSEFRLRQLLAGVPESDGIEALERAALEIPFVHREQARRFLAEHGYRDAGRPLVALHPGSGGGRKCWPVRNFFGLAGRLRDAYDAFLLIFSGPAEDDGMRKQIDDFAAGRTGVLHVCNAELPFISALLSISSLSVGNDSGITHLASAAGGQVVAVFGPTDPVFWSPRGNRVKVISSRLECAPCETGFPGAPFSKESAKCGRKCLSGISVERVYEAAADMLRF